MLDVLPYLIVAALVPLAVWLISKAKRSHKSARVALGGLLLLAGLGAAMDAPHRQKIEDAEKEDENEGESGDPPEPSRS
jgi:hypothetical protein